MNPDTPIAAPANKEYYSDIGRLVLYVSRPEERRARALWNANVFGTELFKQMLQMRVQQVHEQHPNFHWDYILW